MKHVKAKSSALRAAVCRCVRAVRRVGGVWRCGGGWRLGSISWVGGGMVEVWWRQHQTRPPGTVLAVAGGWVVVLAMGPGHPLVWRPLTPPLVAAGHCSLSPAPGH